jgi:alanyl-tRNA synthetase
MYRTTPPFRNTIARSDKIAVTMTERLYYTDSYLRDFTALVVGQSDDMSAVYLNRTAFYPTSGGQPFDLGSISGVAVVEVVDEGDRIAHRIATPVAAGPVDCAIDWRRRFDHMQQHTGQHLISAVFEELFALRTVSFHLGPESATIDVEGVPVDAATLLDVERRANEIVYENRPVTVRFESAAEAQGLRKPSDREGTLRIVGIEGLDRSACGGTHVRATGEIGVVLLRKMEKIRQSTRVEFLCGARAVRRARADFDALTKTSQLFSAPLDDVPSAVATQLEAARAGEKTRKKLELDLAAYRGKELYGQTEPGPDGVRRAEQQLERGTLEELRAVAQHFTAQGKAVFVASLAEPPSVLLATSADSGVDAGQALKAALAAAGGRGGGNARMAQGSVESREALNAVVKKLSANG